MAGVTTYLFYQYMQGIKAKATATSQVPMQTVVVAKVAIPNQTLVTAKMVGLEQVPKNSVQPDAVTSIDQVTGKVAVVDISPNEMILSHHLLSPKAASSLAYKIKPGQRAITVETKQIADTVANLIEPGDHVDVLFHTKTQASVLLQDVVVLAVNQRMTPPNPKDSYKPYTMVTLEVSPNAAIQIINAEQKGTVTFMLRSSMSAS